MQRILPTLAAAVCALGMNAALAVPPKPPAPSCPPGFVAKQMRDGKFACVKAEPVKAPTAVNDPEPGPKGPGAGGPHPIDPLPPGPRPKPIPGEMPKGGHLPRDPGMGNGQQPVDPGGTAVPVPVPPKPQLAPVKPGPTGKPVPIEDCKRVNPPTC
jgi:hypothetical protein